MAKKTQTFVTDRTSPIDGTPSANQFPAELLPLLADFVVVSCGVGMDSMGMLVGILETLIALRQAA
jgi:hypothetical protein